MAKQYIRGNIEKPITECLNCNNPIVKNSLKQIVYFCSKKCRKEYRDIINNRTKHKKSELTKV